MLCQECVRLIGVLEDKEYLYEIISGHTMYTLRVGIDDEFKGKTLLEALKQFEDKILLGKI